MLLVVTLLTGLCTDCLERKASIEDLQYDNLEIISRIDCTKFYIKNRNDDASDVSLEMYKMRKVPYLKRDTVWHTNYGKLEKELEEIMDDIEEHEDHISYKEGELTRNRARITHLNSLINNCQERG